MVELILIGTLLVVVWPREVVERIGLPRKDFFICSDDLEWTLGAKLAGFAAFAVPSAVIFREGKPRMLRRLGRIDIRNSQPPWKHYCGMRNTFLMLNRFPWPKRVVEKSLYFIVQFLGP